MGSSSMVRAAGKLLHEKKREEELSLRPVARPFALGHSSVCSFKVLKLKCIQIPYLNEKTRSLEGEEESGQEMP